MWSTRPARIIQPLAPYFTEIEENKEYIEKEDEFENTSKQSLLSEEQEEERKRLGLTEELMR